MNSAQAAADTVYPTPFGRFDLLRFPARKQEKLQAWCSADSLLLEEAAALGVEPGQALVVNDEHGALSVALQPAAMWTDSALSAIALRQNLARNQLPEVPLLWSIETPPGPQQQVLLRIPKQLPYLEFQLATLSRLMPAGALLLAAGMDKHLSPHTAAILEHYIGPTTRHRGRRKARLFSAVRNDASAPAAEESVTYFCAELEQPLSARANVFSREQADQGSRFLLANLRALAAVDTVIDLACGNGILGLTAFSRQLCRRVVFCDESAMAIASARDNAMALFADAPADSFLFQHGDGLSDYGVEPAGLILCNPPFHIQHVVDEFAGRRLLRQSTSALAENGKLLLVANRHLNYGATLKRLFPRVTVLAANSKFNLWLGES